MWVVSASRHWIWLPVIVALAACGTAPDGKLEVASVQAVGVRMTTALGEITFELYPDQAPLTVANFLRYVDESAFEEAVFYRTVTLDNDKGSPEIEVIQGGLMVDESPFPAIEHETTAQTGLRHVDGALSMARAEVGTAASEFFICIGDQPALDFGGTRNPDTQGFAVFGRVVDGMDVVRRIHSRPADGPSESEYMQGQMLAPTVEIRSVERTR
jgi:peptidyl-prolyl cis-trans isomerase A (cyclophilin A)